MRVPRLSLHKATGQFYVYWGNRRHYLGTDRRRAESLYLDQLAEWKAWRDKAKALQPVIPRASRTVTVGTIIDEFCAAKRIERGHRCEDYYLYALQYFRDAFGNHAASLIRPGHIERFKQTMMQQRRPDDPAKRRFSNKTVNHQLTAVRVLYNWATANERIPMVNFRGIKNLPLGPTLPRFLTVAEVKDRIKRARSQIAPWFATQYLTLMRPSEMVRVSRGEGEWIEDGVFVLHRGKIDEHSTIRRHVCFSPLALKWLRKVEPTWASLVSYSKAAAKCGVSPKTLQKSAARHLAESGARRDDIEQLLNHIGPRIAVSYFHPVWQRLREVASALKV